GVDGEIAKLDTKIKATEMAKSDVLNDVSKEQRVAELNRMKQNQQGLNDAVALEKNVVLTSSLDNTGLAPSTNPPTKQEVDDARERVGLVKPGEKELATQIKEHEKALNVREALGPKKEGPTQGNGHGMGV